MVSLLLQQLTEMDQELYQNFPLVISERWQSEVSETVFDTINQEADKIESKKKSKHRKYDIDEKGLFSNAFLYSLFLLADITISVHKVDVLFLS